MHVRSRDVVEIFDIGRSLRFFVWLLSRPVVLNKYAYVWMMVPADVSRVCCRVSNLGYPTCSPHELGFSLYIHVAVASGRFMFGLCSCLGSAASFLVNPVIFLAHAARLAYRLSCVSGQAVHPSS